MKKLLLFLLFSALAFAQGTSSGNITAAGTTCGTTNACVVLAVSPSVGSATVNLSGTFSATVQFEGSTDGVTWSAASATPIGSSTAVTSATAAGTWRINAAGLAGVRVRGSTYVSGTVVVKMNSGSGSASTGSGGGGTVTNAADLTLNHVMLGAGANAAAVDSALVTDGAGALSGATSISSGTAPAGIASSATGVFGCTESGTTGLTPTASVDYIHCNSTLGGATVNNGTAGEFLIGRTVAGGTLALGTSAIGSGACATVVQETTVTAGAVANVATTDVIVYTPAVDPTGVTGYAVSASGSVYIWMYPTAGHVNAKVCNNTSGSLTPSALTLNWRVAR